MNIAIKLAKIDEQINVQLYNYWDQFKYLVSNNKQPNYHLYYNNEQYTVAYADSTTNSIHFNLAYIIHATKFELNQIMLHELAHIITDHLFKNTRHHGKEWRLIAKQIGVKNPSATVFIKKINQNQS